VNDLAISIVSYRTPALLRQCLDALGQERAELNVQITVVDNAGGDGSAELVEAHYPWVRLIRNDRNRGFGAAHNQAMLGTGARHHLILNSDTEPEPGALVQLVAYLDKHADVAVVGPRLIYPNGRTQPSRRRFPTTATLFLESTQLQRFWPHNAELRRYYVEDRPDDREQDVDWLAGACLCVRGEALRQVGMFDERFCRRVKAAGWRVVYVPSARVGHVESASASQDLLSRDQYFQTSKVRYAAKWHGPRVALALRAYLVLEYLARGFEEALKMAIGSRVAERRARLRVIGNGVRHALFN
jgi:N-acetylglucosaminyl-diphospho-decaprenol L-rhamnosyltransferase